MNKMPMNKGMHIISKIPLAYGISLFMYAILFVCLYLSFSQGVGLPGIYRWILGPSLLICKDIWQYGYAFESMKVERIDRKLLENDKDSGNISLRYHVGLLNRKFLFPVVLTIYLVYILIDQTQVWSLHVSTPFLALNESFLLTLTVVSGILMVFGEEYDKKYIKIIESKTQTIFFLIIMLLFSGIGGYVILEQVITLGFIGMIIANIVVLLLFLVGMLLLTEDGEML